MSRRQSHQPSINNTYNIEMLHRYPFQTAVPQNYNAVVRMTRRFRDSQYEELRFKVESHSQLRHPSLIRIMRATVNRNARHFNIYYEHVSYNLRNQIGDMTIKQIRDNQLRLFDLCSQLMSINIYPEVAEELIGITQNGFIKLYLDVDYRELDGNENKQDLLMAKEIEINSIFNKYLTQVPSVKALKHYRSAPSIKGYNNVTLPYSPISKKSITRGSRRLRESEVIEAANYMPLKRPSIRNSQPIQEESFVRYTGPNDRPFYRGKMTKQYDDSQVPTSHETYENRYIRQPDHTSQLYIPGQMQIGDHQSHSTYHEEMGEAAQMPKIAVTGLRQTAPTSKLENKISAQEKRRLNQKQIYDHGYEQGQKNFTKQKAIGIGHSKRLTAVSNNQVQSEQRNWAPQAPVTTIKPLRKYDPSQQYTKQSNNYHNHRQPMSGTISKQYHRDQQQNQAEQQQLQELEVDPQLEIEQVEQCQQQQQSQHQSHRKQNNQKLQARARNEFMYMDSDDPLTKQFNNLFDSHVVHESGSVQQQHQQPPPRESIRTKPRQSTHKRSQTESQKNLINERVQRALENSQAMLNHFYASNPYKQPM